jgi:zinc transport system permease protein
MAVLDAAIVVLTLLFYDKFLVISFQPELARLRGIRVGAYHTLLLVLTSLTVVLLTQVVGLVMVIALLTLPAATALQFAARLWSAMILATALGLLFAVSGIAISYGPELPTGATVIEIAGATYLLALLGKWMHRRIRVGLEADNPASAGEGGASGPRQP